MPPPFADVSWVQQRDRFWCRKKQPLIWWDVFISFAVDPHFNRVFLDVFSSSPTRSWWSGKLSIPVFFADHLVISKIFFWKIGAPGYWSSRIDAFTNNKGALREKVDAPCFRPRFKMRLFWTERGSQIQKSQLYGMYCTKCCQKNTLKKNNNAEIRVSIE